jgi:predicted transcriptional regulator
MSSESGLITLTANIVSAHVTNNSVAVGDVANLVQQVHSALAKLGIPEPTGSPEAKVPVVSVKASIRPEYLVCMECGRKQKMLKRHLLTAHDMTPDEYRTDYGLPETYPMTAPAYSQTRRDLAHTIGLGLKKAEAVTAEPVKQKRTRLHIAQPPTSGD